jgi:hypothetical protein
LLENGHCHNNNIQVDIPKGFNWYINTKRIKTHKSIYSFFNKLQEGESQLPEDMQERLVRYIDTVNKSLARGEEFDCRDFAEYIYWSDDSDPVEYPKFDNSADHDYRYIPPGSMFVIGYPAQDKFDIQHYAIYLGVHNSIPIFISKWGVNGNIKVTDMETMIETYNKEKQNNQVLFSPPLTWWEE